MENGKRKRGISLIRNVRQQVEMRSEPKINLRPEKSQETAIVTTRFSYSRYPTGQSISRHASAPKPKITFAYPINYQAESCIRNSSYNSYISQQPRELPQPKQVSLMYSQQTLGYSSQNFTHQRYPSFQECKQSIGRKLFGGSRTYIMENSQFTERSNKCLQSQRGSEAKATDRSPLEECKEKRKNLQIQREVFSIKPDITTIKPVIQTRQISVSTEELIKISTKQNIVPSIPQPKPEPKKKNLNPLKLKEMQQRLLQIIKICDQNI